MSALPCPGRSRPLLAACSSLALSALLLSAPRAAVAEDKVTFEDQISPLLRNRCLNCHNPDKSKGDLDLSTYSALLKGGGSGKAVAAGDPDSSKLLKSILQTEEPFMPFNAPKIPDTEIDLVRKWIAGGLLERASSKAVAAAKPKADAAFKAGSAKRPDGPAILPIGWLQEPVKHTERATTVTALAEAPWSPLIAIGGQHQLLLYNNDSLELAGILPFPDGNPETVHFSRDGRLLVVGGGHGAKVGFVDLYDVVTGQKVSRVGNEFDSVLASDLNSDQTEVALGGPSRHVRIYSARDGSLLRDLKKHTDWITAVEYSPDSVLLASGDRNGGLVVWEADNGQELYTLTGHQSAITALSWREDSQVLLSASEDGTIRLWNMAEGNEIAKWNAHRDGVLDARFAHDGRIASCGRDRQICLWDSSGKKQKNWEEGGDLPVRAAFSHDGARVVTASWSGKVRVWQSADAKPVGEVSPNPPTLAERLDAASRELTAREAAAKQAEDALAQAEKKLAETKTAAEKARAELASAKAETKRIRLAQADTALHAARDLVADQQKEQDRAQAACNEAEAENAKATKALSDAQSGLGAVTDKIKTLKTDAESIAKVVDGSRTGLNEAAQIAAKSPEDEAAVKVLLERRQAYREATNRVQTVTADLTANQNRSDELARQIKSLTDAATVAASKLSAAKATLANVAKELAARKAKADSLAAEYQKIKDAG